MLIGLTMAGLGTGVSLTSTLVDRTTGTNIGDHTLFGGLAAAFDGNSNQAAGSSAGKSGSGGYIGKTFGAGKIMDKAIVYGSNSSAYVIGSASVTLNLRGKNGTPSSKTDGTLLGTLNFTETDTNESDTPRTITSTDNINSYTNIFIEFGTSGTTYCAEIEMWELL